MNTRHFFVGRALVFLLILIIGGVIYFFMPQKGSVDVTYTIEGEKVTLRDGMSEVEAAPGSASKVVTKYFGNEVNADLNGDGRSDSVFILTRNLGGTGTFYYVVAALNMEDGYVGSDAFLLGDRIAPQTTEVRGQLIVVNYADRKPGESFDVAPSVGKSVTLILDPATIQFGEVAKDFEGEADPSRMTLAMKTWNWVSTTYNDGKVITPRKNEFSITFDSPSTFRISTDCNGGAGEYKVDGSNIVLDKIMSTEMACGDSQEGEFRDALYKVQSYHFTSKGELVFDLKFDSGSVVFK